MGTSGHRQRTLARIVIGVGLALLASALLAGCGSTPRLPVSGTVTLDGRPLESGYVVFRPTGKTPGPTAGAEIVDGRFTIEREDGPFAGDFRVEITAQRPSSRQVVDPETGRATTALEQYLPTRYNQQSELNATIPAESAKELRFALSSES